MDIVRLNVKILFQKSSVMVDAVGNNKNDWTDYYSCHATVSGEGGSEKAVAGLIATDSDLVFTVRYCKTTAGITVDEFRVLLDGSIYNIVSIDHLNFKKKSLKFKCQKVRR